MLQGLMMDKQLLISGILDYAAQYNAESELVWRENDGSIGRYTYGDAAKRIAQLAHALVRLGIKPGDRVATIAWNNQRHFELYFAVAGIGAVLHTINPRLHPEQMAYVINHAEDRILFVDPMFLQLAGPVCQHLKTVEAVVHLGARGGRPDVAMDNLHDYEDLIAEEPRHYDWPELDENTACALCYTSGTTGEPKGVLYSHRAMVLHSYAICLSSTFGFSPRDAILPVVPMFHVNAWAIPYAAPMAGAKLVLPGPGMDGASLHELITKEGCSFLLGVPTVWMNLLGHCRKENLDLDCVERVLVGGAALPRALLDAFEDDFDIRVIQGWGMTEMSPLGTVSVPLPKYDDLPEEQRRDIIMKAGRPPFGVELRIVSEEGEIMPHDGKASGHLQARGPWIAKAYYKSDASTAFTPDGWFDTGDIANIDADGYVEITDRAKDLIKSGGEWISSIDLENAALSDDQVAMAAVIGLRHSKWQERPLMLVVPKDKNSFDKGALMQHLEGRVAKWWLPDAIECIDEIPLGPTGKVLKTKLREQFKDYDLG